MLNYPLLGLFGLLACFLAISDAREAIVGGTEARSHQFPYLVSIQFNVTRGHDCGGGIVGDEVILTAASCVIGAHNEPVSRSIWVIAGSNNWRDNRDGIVRRFVKRIYVSSDFSPRFVSTTGDIALLRLQEPLGLRTNMHVKKLIMPKEKHTLYENASAYFVGFGWNYVKTENGRQVGGHIDGRARYAEGIVLPQAACEEQHSTLKITPRHLCARIRQYHSPTTRGVCLGDGGGPLVRLNVVIGVLAIGQKDCNERNSSGIYTRVSEYMSFYRHAKDNAPSRKIRVYDLPV